MEDFFFLFSIKPRVYQAGIAVDGEMKDESGRVGCMKRVTPLSRMVEKKWHAR